MPRKEKKYHVIYKTTCLPNRKFYIGMHSTNDLEDGYIGSGKRLRYCIRKYGEENHQFEILEFLPDRKSLKEREAEIITELFLEDENCLNLKVGGEGGWEYVNSSGKAKIGRIKGTEAGRNSQKELRKDPKWQTQFRKNCVLATKKRIIKGTHHTQGFKGKKHSPETIAKMKAIKSGHGIGDKNSQFGSCWITNGKQTKKIKLLELSLFESNGWRRGRK